MNDYVVEDSQLSIEYLSKVFNVDLNSHLTIEQKAIARGIARMTDECLKWLDLVLKLKFFLKHRQFPGM